MSLHITPSMDIGLQHVLENGLSLIEQQPVPGAQRQQVLNSLVTIFSEAKLGSQALVVQNLLLAVKEGPAVERFSLFFRYLKESFGDELPERLSEAEKVFADIRDGREFDDAQKARAADLIRHLLTALHRESVSVPLTAPRQFSFI